MKAAVRARIGANLADPARRAAGNVVGLGDIESSRFTPDCGHTPNRRIWNEVQTVALLPIDSVDVTVLVDNTSDFIVPNKSPAIRAGMFGQPSVVRSPLMEGGMSFDGLVSEHGFSVLVKISHHGRDHLILFDAGMTQNAMVENMCRLSISPRDIDTIVLSHGHFDHVMGLHGLVRELGGRAKLPVLVHPEFWNKRRFVIEGREPLPV
jgi:7,8-dihydropterin-6-yl-methyl-4-(beta-D-ribofuranosyl)aminobenzene 5'-phosphate synthase